MKLKAPNLTPGKLQTLTKTKTWLEKLRDDLVAKQKETEDLSARLRAVEVRRSELSAKAALEPDSAVQLAGADQQIAHLTPIVRQKQGLLARSITAAGDSIGSVRSGDIKNSLLETLYEQVNAEFAGALRPFFFKSELENVVRAVATDSPIWDAVLSYLNRRSPLVPDAPTAIKWLSATAEEIGEILDGDTIITIDPITETFDYPDRRAIERHSISISA